MIPMRVSFLALTLLALAAAPAAAADIPAAQAASHAGETATVVGVLTNVHTNANKNIFLDIGGAYPDNVFSGVIFGKGMHNPPDFTPLIGKTVGITGQIKIYYGKPEIVINSADQVKVEH
jgi:hypothetical protein